MIQIFSAGRDPSKVVQEVLADLKRENNDRSKSVETFITNKILTDKSGEISGK